MKRIALFVFVALLFAVPFVALAQDATATAAPSDVTVNVASQSPAASAALAGVDLAAVTPYLLVIVVLGLLVLALVIDNHIIAAKLAGTLTPATFEIVRAALDKGVGELGDAVKLTPTNLDDAVFQEFRGKLDDLLDDVAAREAAKATPPAPQVVVQTGDNPTAAPADAPTAGTG